MKSKSANFIQFIHSTLYPVYVITETWFDSSVLDNEFFPNNYAVYRYDRPMNAHGGVLIAVKSSIISTDVTLLHNNIECLSVKLSLANSSSMTLYAAYVPPIVAPDVLKLHSENITEIKRTLHSNNYMCVLGDFNLSELIWTTDDDNKNIYWPSNFANSNQSDFTDNLSSLNLQQVNGISNMNDRYLDLIFVDEPDAISVHCSLEPFIENRLHHCGIEIYIDCGELMYESIHNKDSDLFNFNKADIDSLNEHLDKIDWKFILNQNQTIDDQSNIFYFILFEAFEKFVPKKRNVKKSKNKNKASWFNDELSNLRNKKNRANRTLKKYPCARNKQRFLDLSVEFKAKQSEAYRQYIRDIEKDVSENPSNFWKYMNNIRSSKGFPACMTFESDNSSEPEVICNLFAKFFQRVYKVNDISFLTTESTASVNNYFNIGIPSITEEDVMEALSLVSKSIGDDGVPATLLQSLSPSIIEPLVIMFNRSLSSGSFPYQWRTSHIVPIFKSGHRNDIANYRGITILSAIPKIFEKIVTKYLSFKLKNFISTSQHGFCKQKSTVTNLCEFTMFGVASFEEKSQFDVVYTDFSKAFDSVNHSILLRKLSLIGLDQKFLNWIDSYLSNRTQYVLLNGYRSKMIDVHSGVPQGSHLGPLLFLVFINDLVDIVKYSQCLLFADDLKIFKRIKTQLDAFHLQEDLDAMTTWCKNNKLELNIQKCRVMTFFRIRSPILYDYKLNNAHLVRVEKIKDLGIIFEPKLTFSAHIDYMIAKSNKVLGLIFRSTSDFRNTKALNCLYTSLVRSILEYGVIIWNSSHHNNSRRLERIQKRYLRYYFKIIKWPYDKSLPYWENQIRMPSYEERCNLAGIDNLSSRRDKLCARFIGDIVSSRVDSPDLLSQIKFYVPSHQLRSYQCIYLDCHRTKYANEAPLFYAAHLFNNYFDNFDFNLSKECFKFNLKNS